MTAEIDTDVVTHWGVRLPGGVIRWDPGYGSGIYIPYTEVEARDDAARSNGVLLTRQQTTTVETTPWVEVTDDDKPRGFDEYNPGGHLPGSTTTGGF